MTWSEGLTLATADFGTYWASSIDPATDETIPATGDYSTVERAHSHGTPDSMQEYALIATPTTDLTG